MSAKWRYVRIDSNWCLGIASLIARFCTLDFTSQYIRRIGRGTYPDERSMDKKRRISSLVLLNERLPFILAYCVVSCAIWSPTMSSKKYSSFATGVEHSLRNSGRFLDQMPWLSSRSPFLQRPFSGRLASFVNLLDLGLLGVDGIRKKRRKYLLSISKKKHVCYSEYLSVR